MNDVIRTSKKRSIRSRIRAFVVWLESGGAPCSASRFGHGPYSKRRAK